MEIALKVENISKRYTLGAQSGFSSLRETIEQYFQPHNKKQIDSFLALNNISMDIEQGSAVGIIGRNGAGKSTLLKVLSRITKPTAGRIEINGRVASLLEVGTGFHPELTGRENIFMNGTILGMTKSEIRSSFDEIVDFSGISQFIDTPVKRYSSGMYVRLAFAVAAHLNPEILIIDEVLAVGDAAFQKKCLGKMQDVSKSGRTVLFVSHNMGLIEQLCSVGVLLRKGEKIFQGSSKEAISRYLAENEELISLPLYARKDRIGNQSVFVQKIELRDLNDQIVTEVNAGQTFDVVFYYVSEKEVNHPKDITFNCNITNQLDVSVFNHHNRLIDVSWPSIQKNGTVRFRIFELPLVDGHYKINYSIIQYGEFLDGLYPAFELTVNTGVFKNFVELPRYEHGQSLVHAEWFFS